MINIDHGIIPASTKQLKEDLSLSNVDLGMLGSLVYLGLVIGKHCCTYKIEIYYQYEPVFLYFLFYVGSLFAVPVYAYCNTKFVLVTCTLANSFGLLVFTMSTNFYLLAMSRFSVGFF